MSEAARETSCDWTVTGMDCGSCATKIKDAVARLPGVSGVEVGIMTERLRLTLDEAQTGRDKLEKTLGGIRDWVQKILNAKRIIITACGTSWHA